MSREVTREQFAEGVGIDGVRIQKAIGDTVRRFNEARQGDVHTRQTLHTKVMGWNPVAAGKVDATTGQLWPWMGEHNTDGEDYGAQGVVNEHRVKGIRNRNISYRRDGLILGQEDPDDDDLTPPAGVNEHHWMVATRMVMFPWPVVLTNAYLSMRAGGNRVDPTTGPQSTEMYANDWQWGATGRADGYDEDDYVDDWRFVVQVASRFDPELRSADAVVYNRYNVSAEAFKVVPHGKPVGDAGTPNFYGLEPEPNESAHSATYPNTYTPIGQVDYLRGIIVDEPLDIPIPALCPIRCFLVQPFYHEGVVTSPWGNGNTHDHFLRQMYSVALTFAEDLA